MVGRGEGAEMGKFDEVRFGAAQLNAGGDFWYNTRRLRGET